MQFKTIITNIEALKMSSDNKEEVYLQRAVDIVNWPSKFTVNDWPKGVLEHMSAKFIEECLFVLRDKSRVPMWPSSLYGAHVRETGTSRHSIEGGRLSDATDMHVSSVANMLKVMSVAETIDRIGGIGIYFNTNSPMFHIDSREDRLVWLCYKNDKNDRNEKPKYLYRENDYVKFYAKLGELLS